MNKRIKKFETGITLIALVITIIVLLILAGVSIAMLTGDNGILTKTTTAKEDTEKKSAEEQVKLAIMASYGTDGKIIETELMNNLKNIEGIANLPTKIPDGETKIIVNGYEVKITRSGNGMEVVATGINSSSTLKEPVSLVETINATNYGNKIDYSVTINESTVNNWKVFYNDGTNVYIILDDYLDASLVPSGIGLNTDTSTYKYDVSADEGRSTLISALSTTNNWTSFVNSKATSAVGTPTLDMLINSWNSRGYERLYKHGDSDGAYRIGIESLSPAYSVDLSTDSSGYADTLYFPHKQELDSCNGYWLSAASSYAPVHVLCIKNKGELGYEANGLGVGIGIRPVVCLNNEVLTTGKDSNGIWKLK